MAHFVLLMFTWEMLRMCRGGSADSLLTALTTVNVCPDYFLLFVETMNWAQISLALDPWMILVFVYG